ncbi:unnamed protein product [Cunninghamella echinulata]
MTKFNPEQVKVFESFKNYQWENDKVYLNGITHILKKTTLPTNKSKEQADSTLNKEYEQQLQQETQNTLQLLQAKHFYFSKFKESFSFEDYLKYENEIEKEKVYERMEKHDFDHDEKFIQGLPNIIKQWVQQQVQDGENGKLWNKSRLDLEFNKAKAFYYSSCVESMDIIGYFTWKSEKEENNTPACPFANLWQNKGKAIIENKVISDEFLSIEKPKLNGPTIITLASPRSNNVLTVSRLNQFNRTLKCALDDSKSTSVLITATVNEKIVQEEHPDRVQTSDTKVISSGIAYEATQQYYKNNDEDYTTTLSSLDHLGSIYYDTVKTSLIQNNELLSSKIALTFINGEIPINSSYLLLWPGLIRVATEHALLRCHLTPSHAPIPPLLLLHTSYLRKKEKNKLPSGLQTYLALAPPELGCLRPPELLYLGLIDVFIPELQLNEAFTNAKRMALCPQPLTGTAIQLALSIQHGYPGPQRIGVWKDEIEKVFGDPRVDFDTVVTRLKEMNNRWSQKILSYWDSLPPALLKTVFKAIRESENKSPSEIIKLEENLNKKWRQTTDYQQYLKGSKEWKKDQDVSFYFNNENNDKEGDKNNDLYVYEVTEKDFEEIPTNLAVCPVTGQSNNATMMMNIPSECPFSKQTLNQSESNTSCPVTGQSAANTAPSEEKSTTSGGGGCPFSNGLLKNMDKVDATICPVTGKNQSATANKNVCPVTGQSNGSCPASNSTNDH